MNDNVDMNALNQKFPTYVSSITYGRMGIMAIESDYNYEELNKAYNSAFKALFVSGSNSTTEQEKRIIDESSMKIYIIGVDGNDAVETVNGFDAFVQFIIKGGTFSPTNPGVPIYFSLSHLDDHTVVKTKFKINIDTQPVYARIEYQNKEDYGSYSFADIYLAFYSDMTGTNPTVPQDNVKFQYKWEISSSGYFYGPYDNRSWDNFSKDSTSVVNTFKQNKIRIKQRELLHNSSSSTYVEDYGSGGSGTVQTSDNFDKSFMLNPGSFYKVLTPVR